MKRLLVASAVLFALAGCGPARPADGPPHASYWKGREAYDDLFASQRAASVEPIDGRVVGAIAPHHLFVGPDIARFYNALASQSPSVVVLVGPNHFDEGRARIQTTDRAFDTPYGRLEPDTRLIDALVARGIASIEPPTFDGEHSISTHVAFVKRAFPDATVVPIVLKVSAKPEESAALASALDELLPRDALVLASVDFSHYLPEAVADPHDEFSHAVIELFALDRVPDLEIDSPPSIDALLRYLDARGARRIAYDEHTNSGELTVGPPPDETTSHFYMAFVDGDRARGPAGTIAFYGDTIAGRGIADAMANGIDPLRGIRGTEDRFFRGYAASVANLEGPITGAPAAHPDKPVSFAFAENDALPILRTMRVTAASLANNHVDDAGERGRTDTLAALDGARIAHPGLPGPCATLPIVDGSVAVCSFTDANGFLETDTVAKAIREAKASADFVVVSLHWGIEYATEPSAEQRAKAAAIVAAGADAIVGHGPHVVQPTDTIDGAPVFYSIGNFLFDQPDPGLSSGVVAVLSFSGSGVTATSLPIETAGSVPRYLLNK